MRIVIKIREFLDARARSCTSSHGTKYGPNLKDWFLATSNQSQPSSALVDIFGLQITIYHQSHSNDIQTQLEDLYKAGIITIEQYVSECAGIYSIGFADSSDMIIFKCLYTGKMEVYDGLDLAA